MHNPAHATAVAEIELLTADYCKGAAERSSADVDLLSLSPTSSPLDRAADMLSLAAARQHVATCYQITGVRLGILDAAEQAWWARSTPAVRRNHLKSYFNFASDW